jgi:DNA-binding MarR family transcriptional regulator
MHVTDTGHEAQQISSALLAVMTNLKSQMTRTGHDFAPAFVLYRVAENEPVRVSDLATSCGLDASTVSRHVKTLEEEGYVARSGDPNDRRASRVALTERGRSYLADLMALRTRFVSGALADWSPADRTTLLDLTQRLAAALTLTPISTEMS